MDKQNGTVGFARYLSSIDVWAIAFGCMVGWGAFVMPGTTFFPTAGPLGTLIAMSIGVVIMLIIGSNYSFLMIKRPGTGGAYSYTKEAFGRDQAFLCAWFLCLSYLTIVFLNGTALFVVVRTMLGDVLQRGYHYVIAGNDIYLGEVAVSVIALAVVGLLFVLCKPILQHLHTILSIVLLASAVIIVVECVPHIHLHDALSFGTTGINRGYAVFSLVLLAPWAFVGFDVISFETTHFKFPIRKTKWIIILAIILTAFAYTAMAFVSISAVPEGYDSWQAYFSELDQLSGMPAVPVFYAVRQIMGTPGLVIAGICALAAILTGMIGAYRATTRVLSTMAEDRILTEKFSATSYSILFIMILSILIAFLGRNALDWFIELTAFGAIVGFGYTSASALKLARMENNKKVLLTGAVGTVITVAFAIVQLIPNLSALEAMGAPSFFLLSLWCLIGFVFYWRTVNHSTLSEYSGISASGIVLFALLLYAVLMWFVKRLMAAETMEQVHRTILREGIIMIAVVFIGLIVMLYIQGLVRKKHETIEREKIHAIESSRAKSQFLFNMSHDIRTPMNAIIGYTKLAKQEEMPPKVSEYLGKIEDSSGHLLSLINDVLEMSRIESGTLEAEYVPADLTEIFTGLKDLFTEQMKEKQITFSVYTSQVRHLYVWCDKKNLTRMLLNLLSNAYKFTPEGGTVSAVLWEISDSEEGFGAYEMRIRDSGIGMSAEFKERMFTAFERERTSTVSGIQGTGLGLAITKSIADMLGGTIDVITSPGAGTEFILRFRFALANEEEVRNEEPQAEPQTQETLPDFSGMRLLLVEDNDVNREIAVMILSQQGFRIETAENGKVGVDMVAASAPGYYDAVLMDIQMPVMDGYTATRTIRALGDPALSAIPVIAMTANAFREDEQAAADAGMQGHIAKPIDIDKMMETITDVLRGR